MLSLYCKIKSLTAQSDRGVTSVEYALILVLIVAVIAAAVTLLGNQIATAFQNATTNLTH